MFTARDMIHHDCSESLTNYYQTTSKFPPSETTTMAAARAAHFEYDAIVLAPCCARAYFRVPAHALRKNLRNHKIVMAVVRNLKLVNYMIKLYEVNVILISDIIILINKNNNNLNNNKIINPIKVARN